MEKEILIIFNCSLSFELNLIAIVDVVDFYMKAVDNTQQNEEYTGLLNNHIYSEFNNDKLIKKLKSHSASKKN